MSKNIKTSFSEFLNENTTKEVSKGKEGDCYKNVQDYLLENDLPNAFIIHGQVINKDGQLINHAWIENGDEIIDPTTGISTSKEKYDEKLSPKEEYRYDFSEALKMRFKTNNYGAWTSEERKKIIGR